MKACKAHNQCVVVFNGEGCPLCKAEQTFKTIWEELEKSMGIMKEIKQTAVEAILKSK